MHGILFDAILFTNFDQEHGEFYTSMDEYFAAKCKIFEQRKPQAHILLNADDAACASLLAKNPDFTSYSCIRSNSTYYMSDISYSLSGICAYIQHGAQKESLRSPLIGSFNAANILGALAVCHALGVPLQDLINALRSFEKVPGRLEVHTLPNGARAFIDYAHNPSSVASVLKTLREFTDHLIVVCGAGGDRDAAKRPLMGSLAAQYADLIFLTTDNPRSEDPLAIINDMLSGIPGTLHHKVHVELDREQAIKKAYQHSRATSIIALLGKGPDHYQLIKNQKIYFNEAEILQQLL